MAGQKALRIHPSPTPPPHPSPTPLLGLQKETMSCSCMGAGDLKRSHTYMAGTVPPGRLPVRFSPSDISHSSPPLCFLQKGPQVWWWFLLLLLEKVRQGIAWPHKFSNIRLYLKGKTEHTLCFRHSTYFQRYFDSCNCIVCKTSGWKHI